MNLEKLTVTRPKATETGGRGREGKGGKRGEDEGSRGGGREEGKREEKERDKGGREERDGGESEEGGEREIEDWEEGEERLMEAKEVSQWSLVTHKKHISSRRLALVSPDLVPEPSLILLLPEGRDVGGALEGAGSERQEKEARAACKARRRKERTGRAWGVESRDWGWARQCWLLTWATEAGEEGREKGRRVGPSWLGGNWKQMTSPQVRQKGNR